MIDKPFAIFSTLLLGILVAFYWQCLTGRASFYLGDITHFWQPFLTFIGQTAAKGELPLWNPYRSIGESQLAIMSPSFWYLPNLIFAVAPFNTAYAGLMLINQLAAGSGMFLLVRASAMGVWPAVFSGLAYALCGMLFSLQTSSGLQATAAWLPLLFYALKCIGKQPKAQTAAVAATGFLTYLLIGAGVPEVFTPSLLILVGWTVITCVRSRQRDRQSIATACLRLLALLSGIFLSMPELLPAAEWARLSSRAQGLPLSISLLWTGNWYDMLGIILPSPLGDRFTVGSPLAALAAYGRVVTPYIASCFLGPIVVTLAVAGFTDKRWSNRYFVLALFALSTAMAFALNMGMLPLLVSTLKLNIFRFPIKLAVFSVFSLVVAAARGMQRFADGDCSRYQLALACVWGTSLLTALAVNVPSCQAFVTNTLAASAPPPVLELACSKIRDSAIVMSSLGLAACLCIELANRNLIRRKLASVVFIIVSAMLFWVQADTVSHDIAPADFFERPVSVLDILGKEASQRPLRVMTLYSEANAPAGYYYSGNRTIDTYQHARQILLPPTNVSVGVGAPFAGAVGETADFASLLQSVYSSACTSAGDSPLANLCKLTSSEFALQQQWEVGASGRALRRQKMLDERYFSLLHSIDKINIRIYKVKGVLPRAYFARAVRWGSPHAAVVQYIGTSVDFDPGNMTILEHAPGEQSAPQAVPSGKQASIVFTKDERQLIQLEVDSESPGYLVLSDTDYPGWQATVDDKSSTIYRANGICRAVFVPAGKHTINFRFWPDSFTVGFFFVAAAVLIIVFGSRIASLVSDLLAATM
jgi:hypothetical protein